MYNSPKSYTYEVHCDVGYERQQLKSCKCTIADFLIILKSILTVIPYIKRHFFFKCLMTVIIITEHLYVNDAPYFLISWIQTRHSSLPIYIFDLVCVKIKYVCVLDTFRKNYLSKKN